MCIHSGVLFTLVTVFFWENKNDLKSPNKKKSGCGCDRSIYSIDVFGVSSYNSSYCLKIPVLLLVT